MKLSRENTTALVIDLQEKIVPAMTEAKRLVENAKFLISSLSVYAIPIVATRQYPKGLGDTFPEVRQVMKNTAFYDKTTFSCLDDDVIRNRFNADLRPNVILAGIETHICVLQTALDLLELGKNVYLATDCVSSGNLFDQRFALKRLFTAGVVPSTSEALLYEIAGKAGSSEFKELSRLVKERR